MATEESGVLAYKPTLKNRIAHHGLTFFNRLLSRYTNAQLISGPLTYFEDGFATCHNADFLDDPRFQRAYDLAVATNSWNGWHLRWRAYVACWAAEKVADLPGDFVECGVNRGALSRAIIDYIDFPETGKKFWLCDTFAGLDSRYVSEAERARGLDDPTHYPDCYDEVVETFRGFNVELVRGPIPDTLPLVDVDRVAYLSIDMNCAMPEIAAAEHFWDRMVPGAVLVHDDYGGTRMIEQKRALDDFAKRRGVSVLCLPTGQGLIFKP